MEFLKKQAAGFYLALITLIFAIVSIVFYLINCSTSYFQSYGVNGGLIALTVIAIILCIALIIGSELLGSNIYLDILPVITGVCLVIALVTFISIRVDSIASIITFQNNEQTMSDLTSAIVGIGGCLMAVIFNIIASFFRIVKE